MKKIYFFTLILLSFTLFATAQTANTDTTDIGVEINGVIWATRNVDMPKKFAANPYDIGMLYQYDRNIGWSSTDPLIASDGSDVWNTTYSFSPFWQPENDPCPNGWRVPSPAEFQSLVDAGESYFIPDYHFNGGDCAGRIFGDYFNNNYIFLRSYGSINMYGTFNLIQRPEAQSYWSNTLQEITSEEIAFVYLLLLDSGTQNYPSAYTIYGWWGIYAEPVRCVKEANTVLSVTSVTLNKSETSLVVNDTEQLTATIFPANATNQNVSWTSSNRDIADISINGLITANSVGTAVISVTTQDGGYTAICDVEVTNNSGIDNVLESSVQIYPNPVTDELRITNYELRFGDKIKITDLTGKIVLNSSLIENSINVKNLSSGIYLIKIETDKGIKTAKFIKK